MISPIHMMNHSHKEWRFRDNSSKSLQEKLLSVRGIEEQYRDKFFRPDISHLSDPFLFRDMAKAVERIKKAIENQERIVVFGDYDVDGVTGTAILVQTLLKLKAHVSYRVPHRIEDGYGLKNYLVDEIAGKDVKVLITVDNGISAKKEIDHANSYGIDVIITDHHSIPEEIPKAYAILHPKVEGETYPFKHLSGSGVAFVFARAILQTLLPQEAEEFWREMIDLASLGTVADCVPLIGENRVIVKEGLRQLQGSRHAGLDFLMKLAEVDFDKISTHTIGFVIGPRLNAGGRMDTPIDALHLLLFGPEKGQEVAEKLHFLNTKRQQETLKIFEEAVIKVETEPRHNIIVVAGDWHIGVIGIVASKLVEKYGCPVIILGKKDKKYVASCRSIEQVSIIGVLRQFGHFFNHFGGHEGAAGFDIDASKLEQFKKEITEFMDTSVKESFSPLLWIDAMIGAADINWNTYDFINSLAPFGQGNESPVFAMEDMAIKDLRWVGKSQNHCKMLLQKDGKMFGSIAFSADQDWKNLKLQEQIDVAFELEKNEFNSNTKLDLIVRDVKKK